MHPSDLAKLLAHLERIAVAVEQLAVNQALLMQGVGQPYQQASAPQPYNPWYFRSTTVGGP